MLLLPAFSDNSRMWLFILLNNLETMDDFNGRNISETLIYKNISQMS